MKLKIRNTDGRMGNGVNSVSYSAEEDGTVSRTVKWTDGKKAETIAAPPAGQNQNALNMAWNRSLPGQKLVDAPRSGSPKTAEKKSAFGSGKSFSPSRMTGIESREKGLTGRERREWSLTGTEQRRSPTSQRAENSGKDSWAAGLTETERRERKESVHRQLEELKQQSMALDPTEVTQSVKLAEIYWKAKKLRASIGEQTISDRLGSVGEAVTASSVSAGTNIVGLGARLIGTVPDTFTPGMEAFLKSRINTTQSILQTGKWGNVHLTPEMREQFEQQLNQLEEQYQQNYGAGEAQREYEARHPWLSKVENTFYEAADRSWEMGEDATANAKEGLGKTGQLAVDAGIVAGQMAGDAFLAGLTGLSPDVFMAVRTFGNSAQEARRDGADVGEQLAYGAGNAGIALGTAWGAGKLNELANNSEILQALREMYIGKVGLSGTIGGLEAGARTGLQSGWRRSYDPDAEIDWSSVWRNALIGALIEGVKTAGRGAVQGWKKESGTRQSNPEGEDSFYTQNPGNEQEFRGNRWNESMPPYEMDANRPYSGNASGAGKGSMGIGNSSDGEQWNYTADNDTLNDWLHNGKTGRYGGGGNGDQSFRKRNRGNFER